MLPFLIFYVLISLYIFVLKKRETKIFNQILYISIFLYILYVLKVSLLPIPLNETVIQNMIETNTDANHNFIPFHDIYTTLQIPDFKLILMELSWHILLFIPLGFYAPWFSSIFKKLKSTFVLGIVFSLLVSLTQFFISLSIGVTYLNLISRRFINYKNFRSVKTYSASYNTF
ncbi:VanZ family protein [Gracilibacillus boraciitolerans]